MAMKRNITIKTAIKSENEIKYMKDAGILVKAGMQTAFDSIKEGVKQSTVAGKIKTLLLEEMMKHKWEESMLD